MSWWTWSRAPAFGGDGLGGLGARVPQERVRGQGRARGSAPGRARRVATGQQGNVRPQAGVALSLLATSIKKPRCYQHRGQQLPNHYERKLRSVSTNISVNCPDATQLLPGYYPSLRVAAAKDKAPRRTSIARAHTYQYWQPNDHNAVCVLVVDIDANNWVLPFWEIIANNRAIMPTWVIEKRENGHGQLGWLIEPVALGENARIRPITYANAVRYALTQAFGGDANFTNARCWNPTWTGWATGKGDVTWGIVEPRSLGVLHDALMQAGLWVTEKRDRRPTPTLDRDSAPGRNCHVFDVARLRSGGTVEDAAHAANNALDVPLSPNELRGIIRSIERWEAVNGPPWQRSGAYSVRSMTDEEREQQRERGRRGGLAGTEAQRAARAQGPAAASVTRSAEAVGRAATARAYKAQGLTNKQIAEKMGAGLTSVKRWLRQTRDSE